MRVLILITKSESTFFISLKSFTICSGDFSCVSLGPQATGCTVYSTIP
jgi:hypothetical protein